MVQIIITFTLSAYMHCLRRTVTRYTTTHEHSLTYFTYCEQALIHCIYVAENLKVSPIPATFIIIAVMRDKKNYPMRANRQMCGIIYSTLLYYALSHKQYTLHVSPVVVNFLCITQVYLRHQPIVSTIHALA